MSGGSIDELVTRYLETGVVDDELRAALTPEAAQEWVDVLPELDRIRAELAQPAAWAEPPATLEDMVLAAVRDEADRADAAAPTSAPSGVAGTGVAPGQGAPQVARTEPSVVALADARARRSKAAALVASLVAAAAIVAAIVGFATRPSASTGQQAAPPGTTSAGPVSVGTGVEAALQATELAPGAGGKVRLDETASGVWIRLDASGLPRRDNGAFYEAWAKTPSGLVPVGTFHTGDKVVLWSGVAIEDTDAITVTLEDDDGNQDSSGRRVLLATIPHTGPRSGSTVVPATGAPPGTTASTPPR